MHQFDIAFEGVYSLRDIEMAIKPLSDKEIKDNMGDLKKKLAVNFCQISYFFSLQRKTYIIYFLLIYREARLHMPKKYVKS